jgi:hypothetical protein
VLHNNNSLLLQPVELQERKSLQTNGHLRSGEIELVFEKRLSQHPTHCWTGGVEVLVNSDHCVFGFLWT